MRATDGTLRIVLLRSDRQLVSRVVATSIFVALAIGAFLLARRAAGAFSAPLPVPQLLATAVVAAAWAVVVRELSARRPLAIALALIVLLMLAVASSYPGARIIDWLAWPTAMFAVVLCPPRLGNVFPLSSGKGRGEGKSLKIKTPSPCPLPKGEGSRSRPLPEREGHEADAEQVLQQLTRIRTEGGHESIRGLLVGEFAPGERQLTLYTAFCPPFERQPHVEVNVADDSDATVKLTQVLHNGAQLELRLPHPAEESTNVTIELFVTDAHAN